MSCGARGTVVPAEGTTHVPRLSIAPCLQYIDAGIKKSLANDSRESGEGLGKR